MNRNGKYAHLLAHVAKRAPGEAYVAVRGEDFDCQPDSFRSIVYDLAKTKGAGWVGTCTVIGSRVVYTFYKRSDVMRPNLPAYALVKKYRKLTR